jgi:hypothetical protein
VVKKGNGSIPRASMNVGSSSKASEENRIIDQVLPDVVTSGNCSIKEKYFDTR